jgi:hypothetical protein
MKTRPVIVPAAPKRDRPQERPRAVAPVQADEDDEDED